MPYHFDKNEQTNGHAWFYKDLMSKHDFSFAALTIFALALLKKDLFSLTMLFNQLNFNQKQGLLSVQIDFRDIKNTIALSEPWGYPMQIALEFFDEMVVNFLLDAMKQVALFLNKSLDEVFPLNMRLSKQPDFKYKTQPVSSSRLSDAYFSPIKLCYSTNLHAAAKSGDLAEIIKIIDQGVDINVLDSNQKTPLDRAVSCFQWPAINWMITHQARMNMHTEKMSFYFIKAVKDGQLQFIRWLEANQFPLLEQNIFGEHGAIFQAVEAGHIAVIDYFMEKNPPPEVVHFILNNKKTSLTPHQIQFKNVFNFWQSKDRNDRQQIFGADMNTRQSNRIS